MGIVTSASLAGCVLCPRLAAHRLVVQREFPHYHARPVGSWGSPRARILIVGLAPGLHGAYRTGKAFVGDASGRFLFEALHSSGLATEPEPENARLINVQITNAVKCLPPANSPITAEVSTCVRYLRSEIETFCPLGAIKPRAILSLGGVAFRAVGQVLGQKGAEFKHARIQVEKNLLHIASFHPSRLNVNTKRLTREMLMDVLVQAKDFVET